jgi:hypothetical protein
MTLLAQKLNLTLLILIVMTLLSASSLAAPDVDKGKILKTDNVTLPRSASSSSEVELIPLGQAEYPGLCKYRGHEGKYQCLKVKAKKHGYYSCKGKGIYYSKVNGVKGCYSCPKGMKRTSLTRKMNHKKACVNREGKNTYAKGILLGKNLKKCPSGQYKYKGRCVSCPAKTKRQGGKHGYAGIDTGMCKVKKEYRCNAGLKLHKSEPKNIFDRASNWVGLKYKKYCGRPFDLKDYLKEVFLQSEAEKELARGINDLGKALIKTDRRTKDKIANIEKYIKQNKMTKAVNELKKFDEFVALEELVDAYNHGNSAIQEVQKFAISVGITADGSFIAGGNYEYGIAYDVGKRKAKKYQAYGLTKGASVAADGSITVGLWAGEFKTSYSQGYVVSFPVGYGIDGGVGIWSDYYTPKRADGLNQPHFIGITASFGVGSGFEIGEYNEVWTKVKN